VIETSVDELEQALDRLAWPEAGAGEDWPWLTGWLRSPRARSAYVVVSDGTTKADLREAVRRALAKSFALPAAGGNVGNTRGER
jgi:hypothetical protein